MIRLCLVDDDEDLREVLVMFIEENYSDFEITECNNGYEAIEALKKDKFNLLITDLKMPDMDGEELVRRLSEERSKNLPDHILILTGFLGEISDEASKMRNISYLTKPFKQNS